MYTMIIYYVELFITIRVEINEVNRVFQIPAILLFTGYRRRHQWSVPEISDRKLQSTIP